MKAYKVELSPDAALDIKEIAKWYEMISLNLSNKFKEDLKNKINTLKKYPLNFTIRYKDVHCLLLKNFPFLIHYRIDEQRLLISVFAVIHTSRNPGIWHERSENI